MAHTDSIDKIVTVYLAGLCRTPFTYRESVFEPRPVVVSPLLLRGFTCPSGCGACCAKYTMDYLPGEARPGQEEARTIVVNGRPIDVFSDLQADVAGNRCRNLDTTTGRCGIYERRAFSCDFELIRVLHFADKVLLTQKLYGRGWAMRRVDGGQGAQCEMQPPNPHTVADVDRKLRRLQEWADHFGVKTCVPAILEWVRLGEHGRALLVPI
ncbi:YkgJ family cysteine cluster protein [Roseicella aerolata]|uniref:YkgJ family cysteine cluster protein n=1 Tax=Roseicella aerolata TaxID=2883479 RepID=A0A9X1L6V5_9PROT|nr:YkgJ family cysteine cluster protein [Roseicella aerolata]MCB4821246.1 YkgJ family cysteine cluster protein [Roseicella aerolata]